MPSWLLSHIRNKMGSIPGTSDFSIPYFSFFLLKNGSRQNRNDSWVNKAWYFKLSSPNIYLFMYQLNISKLIVIAAGILIFFSANSQERLFMNISKALNLLSIKFSSELLVFL